MFCHPVQTGQANPVDIASATVDMDGGSSDKDGSLLVHIIGQMMYVIAPHFRSLKALANCSMICKAIRISRQPSTPTDSLTSFLHDERLVMAAVMGHTVLVPFRQMKNASQRVVQGVRLHSRRMHPSFAYAVPDSRGHLFYTEAMSLEKAMDVYKLDKTPELRRDYVMPSLIAKAYPAKTIPRRESWAGALHVNLHGGVHKYTWSVCFYRVLAMSMIQHAEFDRTTGDIHLGSWAAGVNKYVADMWYRRESYACILAEILAGEELLPAEEHRLANDTVLQHYLQTGDLLKTGKFPPPQNARDERRMPEHNARSELKSRMRFSHTSPNNMFSLRHLVEHVLYKCSLRMPGVCNVGELRAVHFATGLRNGSVAEILGCGGKNSPLELRWLAGSMGSERQEVSVFHDIQSIRRSSKMVTGRRIIDSLLEMMHEFKLALLEVQVNDEDMRVLGDRRVEEALTNLELTRELYEAVQLCYFELEESEVEFDDTGDAMFPGLQLELIDFQRSEEGDWCNLFDDERVRREGIAIVKKIWTQVYSRLWSRFLAKPSDDFHVCPKNHRDQGLTGEHVCHRLVASAHVPCL